MDKCKNCGMVLASHEMFGGKEGEWKHLYEQRDDWYVSLKGYDGCENPEPKIS